MTKVMAFNDAQCKTGAKGFAIIQSTVEEQALFRRLLQLNSTMISGGSAEKFKLKEHTFSVSFIVPVTSLSQEQIAKLMSDLGCLLCGQPSSSRCAACHSVSYCGPGMIISNYSFPPQV